jgi:hypothetical protein
VEKKFIKAESRRLFVTAPSVDSAMACLRSPRHFRVHTAVDPATSSAAE